MTQGFDCATKLNSATAKTLKAAGFEFVARYLGDSWKTFDQAEAKAIGDAGLKLISIFEKNSTFIGYFTKAQGVADAKEAMTYAKSVGQPVGSAIYFTVDYDAQASHMSAICDYLDGVNETIKDYKVGLYGSYAVMMAVKGKVDYYWQTYAWSKGLIADHIHKHQYQNSVTVSGVALDRNDIKKDPGHWVVAPVTVPKKEEPKPVASASVPKQDAYLHIVKPGDTLSGIAADHGVTLDYLVKLNSIQNPSLIYPGQRIKLQGTVPTSKPAASKPVYHKVVTGDTVSELAKHYGSTIAQIKAWNNLDKNYTIYSGKQIRVK